jgi:flagellar biosynthesis protein FlhG
VVVLDADLGLANIDILLGINSNKTIENVLQGECSLREVMVQGPGGIRVVPASSGTQKLTQLNSREQAGLIQAFSDIGEDIDVLIIDTAAGISENVMSFVRAAQEVIMVVTDEPTSITDAYAQIKLLNRDYGLFRFRIVANMVKTPQEGSALFNKLSKVTDRFLEVALQYVGAIPQDDALKRAVQRQKPVIEAYPRSKAALAFRAAAKKVNSWPLPSTPRGHLEFFVERLVQETGA